MRISSIVRSILPASTASVLLALCFIAPTYAGATATIVSGVVEVDKDGTVWVQTEERGLLFPSNGHGLFQSGKIANGDPVDVKIVFNDKKQKHRGHVTVLK